jgi:hypothetical protein
VLLDLRWVFEVNTLFFHGLCIKMMRTDHHSYLPITFFAGVPQELIMLWLGGGTIVALFYKVQ